MIFKPLILALAIAIGALPGCAPLAKLIGGDSVVEVVPETAANATKALILAHLAYDGVSITVTAAANSGTISGETARVVKCWYDRAGNILRTADQAESVANVPGVMSAIAAAQDAIVQAKMPVAACVAA